MDILGGVLWLNWFGLFVVIMGDSGNLYLVNQQSIYNSQISQSTMHF